MAKRVTREFGDGPLFRATEAVYRVLAPTFGFLVAGLPFAVAVALTDSPIIWALAGIVIGPAWTALLYATRVAMTDRERGAFHAFWRGYALNVRQTLLVWVPYWLLLFIAAADVTSSASPLALRCGVGVLAGVSMLWASAMLLVISRYSFRTRDVLRLGVFLLFGAPKNTLMTVSLLIVAGGVVYFGSELVLGLLAGLFALFTIIGARGAFELLDERFTASAVEV